jgi:putative flippase GtrA
MPSKGHLLSPHELRRFGRFLAVGALGTALDFTLLAALKGLGFPTLPANTLSFSAGVLNNYLGNRFWTFADCKGGPWGRQLAQFGLVGLIGLALNNAIVLSLEGVLSQALAPALPGYLAAKVLATGAVVFWNYSANRFWTFGPPMASKPPKVDPPETPPRRHRGAAPPGLQ